MTTPVTAGSTGADLAHPATAPTATPRRRPTPATPYLLLAPAVAVLLLGMGYPVYWQIITSLQEYGLAQQFGQPPTFVGLDNYARIFGSADLWAVVLRSVAFCLVNAFVTVGIGLAFALLMRAVHPAIKVALQVCLLLAWAMPMVAAVTVFRWLFDYRTGVVNWLLVQVGFTGYEGYSWFSQPLTFFFVATLIIVWMSVPFVALSVFAGLTQVPDEILEAARIDGADERQIFFKVVIPQIKGTLITVFITVTITTMKIFDIVYVNTNGNFNTNVLGNQFYNEISTYVNYGAASAIVVILMIAVIPIMWYQVKHFRAEEAA